MAAIGDTCTIDVTPSASASAPAGVPGWAAQAAAACTRPSGVLNLDGFPLLVYARARDGAGPPCVRLEDTGAPALGVVARLWAGGEDEGAVATATGTTSDHVRQAIAYVEAHGFTRDLIRAALDHPQTRVVARAGLLAVLEGLR